MRLFRPRRAALLPLLVLAPIVGGAASASSAATAASIHITGTAYAFNQVQTVLAGAQVRVAELPRLTATVKANGTYDLTVPDRTKVTPYIVFPGYHSVYLQTFTTAGENLRNVNFQTPTDGIAAALAALLHVPTDASGSPEQCVIVSTLNTKNVRGLSFSGFVGYGAHGVAGASATASPVLAPPTYFNDQVVPDPTQQRSSVDGGVIWTGVPAGTYRLSATAPGTRFAPFDATCAPGRIVNASPPWGLHERAATVPATVTARWTAAGLSDLWAARLPAASTTTVRCDGPSPCFRPRRVRGTRARSINLLPYVGRLRAGQTLQVSVAAPGFNTKVVRWKVGRHGTPTPTTLCVPLGNEKPVPRC